MKSACSVGRDVTMGGSYKLSQRDLPSYDYHQDGYDCAQEDEAAEDGDCNDSI